MLKYKNKGYTIEITLPENKYKGYSVECRYLYVVEKDKYLLSMWLIHNTIENRFKIDSQEIDTQYISGTKETIKNNVCRIVEQAVKVGFFDRYVEEYEYIMKCFDVGSEIENERVDD